LRADKKKSQRKQAFADHGKATGDCALELKIAADQTGDEK
jgi:hypothetical protein